MILGFGVFGEGKCYSFFLESIFGDGFDELLIYISKGRFIVIIMKFKF